MGFYTLSKKDHFQNLKSLSFTETFHIGPRELRSSHSSSKTKKREISSFSQEKPQYDAIKDTNFFFDENKRFVSEINKMIFRKNTHSLRERFEKAGKSTPSFRKKDGKEKEKSKLEKKFFREFQKELPEYPFEPTPEFNVNQLSASVVVSNRFRNDARILRMTPECSQQKYYFSNSFCEIEKLL